MDLSNKIASDLTAYCKYARYLPEKHRRETWDETVDRCSSMHKKRYPKLKEIIDDAFEMVKEKKILPSMRSLQFGGKAIEVNESRIYNCGYMAASYPKFFSELMFLLLGGTGVGYSVQHRHIRQLPTIKHPGKERRFSVQDSIIGWADAVKILFSAYFDGTYLPRFDFDDIRPAGSILKTAGGKAPGPAPLRTCLAKIQGILEAKKRGSKLESWEVSDISCVIADAVLSGGIRRSAMIALFDFDDVQMLSYKTGSWWDLHPERSRVNVSAVGLRSGVTEEKWNGFWDFVKASGSGEPGIGWTSDFDLGSNPCFEISLKHKQFCNLSTINFTDIESQKELNKRAYYASVIGTLQAGYTDFHYLSDEWQENCEAEALLGVSVTGIADGGHYRGFDWREAAANVVGANKEISEKIGINKSARMTAIKPEGSSSLVLGSSSGIHARHAHYYIRRIRLGKDEALAQYLLEKHPELVVQDEMVPNQVIVELPQKSPDRSVYRGESPLDLLERVKYFSSEWIAPGHNAGANKHNVSCTVSVKPHEWDKVGKWMYENREAYNGISVLPFDGGSYVQPPFSETTKEDYEKRMESLKEVNLSKIREDSDETKAKDNSACAGGACEI